MDNEADLREHGETRCIDDSREEEVSVPHPAWATALVSRVLGGMERRGVFFPIIRAYVLASQSLHVWNLVIWTNRFASGFVVI